MSGTTVIRPITQTSQEYNNNNNNKLNHFKITQKVPEQLTGKARYDIKELNKTATFGTAHTAGSVGVRC